MKYRFAFFLLFANMIMLAQVTKVNEQSRYFSDSRLFYLWNEEKQTYDLRDTEFENTLIDIREIGSKSNGYIVISLVDDGDVRTYHGSIVGHSTNENGLPTWVMRSKNARGKLVFDAVKKNITYSYESNDKRYVKIFVFSLRPENLGD